jgi:LysM repeat protein
MRYKLLFLILVVVLLGLIIAEPLAAQTGQRQHVVVAGDTLTNIAVRYNTTVAAIMSANNIVNPNAIYRGQVLIIPAQGGPVVSGTYVVQRGDELRFIAARFNTTWQAIAQINGILNPNLIYPGQVLQIPGTGGPVVYPPPVVGGRYIVQPGDTMFRISARFGVNIYDIARANGLLNLNYIFVGQSLIIP